MKFLKVFTNLLDEFLSQLSLVFPDEQDLKRYHRNAQTLIQMNPRLVLNLFQTYVLPYRQQITCRDETFFMTKDYSAEEEQINSYCNGKDMIKAIRLKALWQVMSDNTKEITWDYMNKLIQAAEKA